MSNVIKLTKLGSGQHLAKLLDAPIKTKIDFDTQYKRLVRRIKKSKGNTDIVELRYMRKIARQLIPVAAEVFQKWPNDRNAKALEILVNQNRDIMADISSLNSGPKYIDHITDRVIMPGVQAILQNYLQDYADLKKSLRNIKDAKLRKDLTKQIQNNSQGFGALLDAAQKGMLDKLQEYFVGKVK